jgi:16S rRNA C1402 (ribose-2'-O) methylase RsmI
LVVRPIVDLISHFADPRGEFTILIPARAPLDDVAREPVDPEKIREELGELTKTEGLKRREALKILADRHRVGVNELYRLLADAGS